LSTIGSVFTSYDPELYIPLTFLSYQIDDALGGGRPAMFHFTNLLLHVLNAVLVAWLLYALIRNGWLSVGLGLIFLTHPLNVEAVAWVSARKDVLSALFFVASFLFWISYKEKRTRSSFWLSFVTFILACLSKAVAITLPVLLILYDLLESRAVDRNSLKEKLPHGMIAFTFGIIALFGKANVIVVTSTFEKLLMACTSTLFYLSKFLVPLHISAMYPFHGEISAFSPMFFGPALILAALLLLSWFQRRHRLAAFGFIFFLVTLSPTFTNFVKGGDMYVASDRYAYVPMIGLLMTVGYVLQRWLSETTSKKIASSRTQGLIGALVLTILCAMYASSVQASVWRHAKTPRYRPGLREKRMRGKTFSFVFVWRQQAHIDVSIIAEKYQRTHLEVGLPSHRIIPKNHH
jgi:hypothetical protein